MNKRSDIKKGLNIGLIVMILLAGIFCSKETAIPVVDWQPVEGKIMTQWAKDVKSVTAHPEYPRPQMKREEWLNLNGMWEYAIRQKEEKASEQYDGYILVPFPVESALSGVKKSVGKDNRLWYRHTFTIPKSWSKKRVLLNFEAVDWETTVWINGRQMGTHRGGYDPFFFDITNALKKRGKQEVVLSVWDPINEGTQPRGKQVKDPHGIWYTSVTGIWGTVWLEPVEQTHIESMRIVTDIDTGEIHITVQCPDKALDYQVELVNTPVGVRRPRLPLETRERATRPSSP